MIKRNAALLAPMFALLLVLALFTALYGQGEDRRAQGEATADPEKVEGSEAAQPAASAGALTPEESAYYDSTTSMQMGGMPGRCPMMSGASSASAIEAERQFRMMTGQGLVAYAANPWWLLGWLVLFVCVVALIAGLIAAAVWLVRRHTRSQPGEAAPLVAE